MGSPPPSPLSNFTNVNGTLYFIVYDSINGEALWKIGSDGNAVLVKDINPGANPLYSYDRINPINLINVDGMLYFKASGDNNVTKLWKIDNAGNAVLVEDINSGADSSYPENLTNVNGILYFTASDANNVTKLWKINNAGNAVLVEGINPGVVSSYESNLTNINGTLYFTARSRQELWKIDTTGAAVLVKDFSSGTDSSYLSGFTNVDGTIYVTKNNYLDNGQQLWKIDNTGDVVLVRNLRSGPLYSSWPEFTNVNGTLYFKNFDTTNGTELWKIDSSGDAVLVKDINPGVDSSDPSNLINVDGTLYFRATNTTNGTELWKIDSSGDAVLVKDINLTFDYSEQPSYLTNVNGTLYFTNRDLTNGVELWKIDSSGEAVLVKDINPGVDSSDPSYLTNVNGTLYFRAFDATHGTELWKIDSSGDAVLVKDIYTGTNSSQPWNLTNIDSTLYFTAINSMSSTGLWKIDSSGNAVFVKDFTPEGGIPVISPLSSQLFNNNLLATTSEIKGVGIQAISQKQTNKVNEIGFFNVDDQDGKIDGIAPGEAGYIKAAINRAKSILTTLGGDFFNTEKQEIGLDPNKIYQFFEIENGSLTEVKQKLDRGETPTNIRLSIADSNGNSPIKVTGANLQPGYNISINNDELVLKVTKLDGAVPNRPIGSDTQGKIESRIIDLTNYQDRSLTVDITTKSDAVYQSQIGFYVVKDALGTIELADGTTVKPGDANYAMVAVKNAISNAGLQSNRLDSKTNQPITGGLIYAPVVVAQGTMNDFVNNPSNNIQAYFNYISANTDKVDHFRQIGANTFGVEDMYGGGDRDFNDIVIQMKIKTV